MLISHARRREYEPPARAEKPWTGSGFSVGLILERISPDLRYVAQILAYPHYEVVPNRFGVVTLVQSGEKQKVARLATYLDRLISTTPLHLTLSQVCVEPEKPDRTVYIKGTSSPDWVRLSHLAQTVCTDSQTATPVPTAELLYNFAANTPLTQEDLKPIQNTVQQVVPLPYQARLIGAIAISRHGPPDMWKRI